MLPDDPFLLLSYINTKLRDEYGSLSALCDDMEVPDTEIVEKLARIGAIYDEKGNCFRQK